ncbi:hypothetical protein HPP92_024821 [Vanilla planifolia]|uniref:Uncharacterized protein n=1 Tax=Vanilla planifolia TaxID=51239 RepID=A0A835U9L6_VANPL|nr:hypothetical protein HPP92_024821 [Vanilla planifolia]
MKPPPPPPPARTGITTSSPGRVEKLPTPGLARLLGGKGGIRTRVRSSLPHTSPLFPSRTRTASRSASSVNAGEEGEPSSPKVTCIGQVRIKSTKKLPTCGSFESNARKEKQRGAREMRYHCFIKTLLCSVCLRRRQSTEDSGGRTPRTLWWRWFNRNAGNQWRTEGIGQPEAEIDPLARPPPLRASRMGGINFDSEAMGESTAAFLYPAPLRCLENRGICKLGREDVDESEEVETTTAPPKNALILMRCRSASHSRSSNLATNISASRFLSIAGGDGCQENTCCREKEGGKTTKSNDRGCHGRKKEIDDKGTSSRPLCLERSKSEPAKKAARLLAPETTECSTDGGGGNGRSPILGH